MNGSQVENILRVFLPSAFPDERQPGRKYPSDIFSNLPF
jgi:hypothetical protein